MAVGPIGAFLAPREERLELLAAVVGEEARMREWEMGEAGRREAGKGGGSVGGWVKGEGGSLRLTESGKSERRR